MSNGPNGYPRVLDREGCVFGQHLGGEFEELKKRIDVLERKLDRLTTAMVMASITFGTAALMLGLNLWLGK